MPYQDYYPTGGFFTYPTNNTIWPTWLQHREPWTATITTNGTYHQLGSDGFFRQVGTYSLGAQQALSWLAWNQLAPTAANYQLITSAGPMPPAKPISAASLASQQRRDMIYRNKQRASQLRRRIAERKARELLIENLSEDQRTEFEKNRFFHVVTKDGLRKYRIDYGLAANVYLVECKKPPRKLPRNEGRILRGSRFCMHVYHPDGRIPNEDNMLAQKLLIETNEAEFLSLANIG